MNDIIPILQANISSLEKENNELKHALQYIRTVAEGPLATPVTGYEQHLVLLIRNIAYTAGSTISRGH